MIKIENVHKSFGNLKVLNGINLEVTKGKSIVVIGSSGSGKSTLLTCINGLEKIQEGKILELDHSGEVFDRPKNDETKKFLERALK